jgi:hypothetical protein
MGEGIGRELAVSVFMIDKTWLLLGAAVMSGRPKDLG